MLTVGVAVKTGLDKPAVRFVAGVLVEPRANALPTGSILLVDPCRGRLPTRRTRMLDRIDLPRWTPPPADARSGGGP
jgi:hypothetical protein